MHMQAKGTTDYKSGFTFAFEQLLNVRTNKLFREGHCKGGCLSEAASRKSSIMPELCSYHSSTYYTSCQGYCLIKLIKLYQL